MIFEDRIQENPRLFRLKDPRTNEIVDFEIQDLLPEEIEQEGTEVDAAYLNGLLTYSMEEKQVGYWTDGKPLYEVTFDAGYLANNGRTTPSISGIVPTTAVVKDIQGVAYRAPSGGQGYNDYMPLCIACSSVIVRPELSTIYLDTTTDRTNWKLTVTLRYTKTTD